MATTAPPVQGQDKAATSIAPKLEGLADLVVNSLQQQSSDTLAKMVLAAVAAQLVRAGVRFAVRHPKTLLMGGAIAIFATGRRSGPSTLR
ncbi:MAG: hypothetical protein J0G94_10860 [Sphingomonadales bacterium]|nr:hypothetical protein [Sphingomonadales bacterium]